jgi:hypothetical protein
MVNCVNYSAYSYAVQTMSLLLKVILEVIRILSPLVVERPYLKTRKILKSDKFRCKLTNQIILI